MQTPIPTEMTLNQIRVFVVVVQLRHISAAARKLGISQPSVSQQIRRLERHFGFPLLQSVDGEMVVTEKGADVYRLARGVEKASGELEKISAESRAGVHGILSVAANSIAAMQFVPDVTRAFAGHLPSVRVALSFGHHAEVMDWVESGQAAIGLSPGPADYRRFQTESLFEVEVALVAAPSDPLARKRRIQPDELRGRNIALATRSRPEIEKSLRAAGISLNPTLVAELPDSEQAKKAAESGLALGFVVRDAALRELRHRYLVEIAVEGLTIRRPFEAIWVKNRRLDRFAETFLAHAREVAKLHERRYFRTKPGR